MEESWSTHDLEGISGRSLKGFCRDEFEDTCIRPATLPFHLRSDHEGTGEAVSFIKVREGNHRSIEYHGNRLTEGVERTCWEYLHRLCSCGCQEFDHCILPEGFPIGLLHRSGDSELIRFPDHEGTLEGIGNRLLIWPHTYASTQSGREGDALARDRSGSDLSI